MVNKKGKDGRGKMQDFSRNEGQRIAAEQPKDLDSAELPKRSREGLKNVEISHSESGDIELDQSAGLQEIDALAQDFDQHLEQIERNAEPNTQPDLKAAQGIPLNNPEDIAEAKARESEKTGEFNLADELPLNPEEDATTQLDLKAPEKALKKAFQETSDDFGDELVQTKEIVLPGNLEEEQVDTRPEDIEAIFGTDVAEMSTQELSEYRTILQDDIDVMHTLLEEAGFDVRDRNELTEEEVGASLDKGEHKHYVMGRAEEQAHLESFKGDTEAFLDEKEKIQKARDRISEVLGIVMVDQGVDLRSRWGMEKLYVHKSKGDTAAIAGAFKEKLGELLRKKAVVEQEFAIRSGEKTDPDLQAVIDQE